jgi:hypothetical protein
MEETKPNKRWIVYSLLSFALFIQGAANSGSELIFLQF